MRLEAIVCVQNCKKPSGEEGFGGGFEGHLGAYVKGFS